MVNQHLKKFSVIGREVLGQILRVLKIRSRVVWVLFLSAIGVFCIDLASSEHQITGKLPFWRRLGSGLEHGAAGANYPTPSVGGGSLRETSVWHDTESY